MNYRLLLVGIAIGLVWLAGPNLVDAQSGRSIWDGVYTAEQADRGAQLYETWCAECHGGELEGGETAPALLGGEFMWAWNGLSVGDI